jgi:pyruvate kinase
MIKLTKIVATVSDLRCDVDFIQALFDAGMNAVRINTAHAGFEGAQQIVDNVRQVSDRIAIIIDTKGPEIRVTKVEEEGGIVVKAGDMVNVKGTGEGLVSTRETVYMNDETLYDDVPVGAVILIDDGELAMEVVEKTGRTLVCRVKNPGKIKSHKSVNIPGVAIELPSITERDREYIEWAIDHGIDFIAHSFVRSADDVRQVQKILDAKGSNIRIIAKIENREGVTNLDEILKETYGVMVARGDLGVEIPAEQIPRVQRHIVQRCIESKKPVIIATQMLHSMITNPRPTRAEVSDIASAIYQRADAIMLSGETASGAYPVEAVETMARIAAECERDMERDADAPMPLTDNETTTLLAQSAVRATMSLPVKAIVIDTMSGRTGRYLSAFRSSKPVYTVCYRHSVMRQLAISYGIHAMYVEAQGNSLLRIFYYLERRKWIRKEDLVAIVGGSFGEENGASFLEIGTVFNLEKKGQ